MSEQSTVLVTGGAGYIGSHTCKALAGAGYLPVTYDNLSQGHDWAVQWGPLVKGDLSDKEKLEGTIREYKPSAVLHFAALLSVGESVAKPGRYYRNNVTGSLDLLDVMRGNAVNRLVFSSTAAVYGKPKETPIGEGHSTEPTNPYGTTKLTVERVLADYARAYGIGSASLRYFNAAGADPAGDIGEEHDPETHLIPLALKTALGERDELCIFGDDYDTPDGTCVRDYIHVSDLADAHVLALRHLESAAEPVATHFNLGNGNGFSVREVIDAAAGITGKPVPTSVAGRRAGDPPVLVADSTRARDVLGWTPRFSRLEDQISHAWNWHKARLKV